MSCPLHRLLYIMIFLLGFLESPGQTTIVFQGGEGTPADNWGFAPITNAGGPMQPGIVNVFTNTGVRSLRAGGGSNTGCSGGVNCVNGGGATGCPMHGKAIEFNTVNVSCLSDVQLSFYHSSHSFCSGNGYDSGERLYFEVNINGSGWIVVGQVGGFGDYTWTYATNPVGNISSGIPQVPNPFVYNVPAGTNSFAFRVRNNTNRSDEVFYIDDVLLTTTTTGYNFPGTAGLWNGIENTNWIDPCNWDNRTLPLAATDVIIPVTALSDCEVFPFTSGTCRNLDIRRKLSVENGTSTLNVAGNITINTSGELDMSLNATEGGTLYISGNWLNQRDASWFQEQASTVHFTGSLIQALSVFFDMKEDFYKVNINKTGGQLRLFDEMWIDPVNSGGAATMLQFTSGDLLLNGYTLRVFNSAPTAIQRIAGGAISERVDNTSRIAWNIGSGTGIYVFPFRTLGGDYIPFRYEPVSGISGNITVSTYGTPPSNLPWPVTPVAVNNLVSASGLSPDNRDATVDRFWHIDATGSPSADLVFTYAPSELPVAPYNDPFTLKSQRYEPSGDFWMPYLAGQNALPFATTSTTVNSFGTYTLTNEVSPLPVTWLDFTARAQDKNSLLEWSTASETNTDKFIAERSEDGNTFYAFGIVPAAGNSNSTKSYKITDDEPFPDITYYRIRQTDYDGAFSYSVIRTVRHDESYKGPVIFPSPASEFFYVQPEAGNQIQIREMSGRIVLRQKLNDSGQLQRIDISALAAGMYLVSFSDGPATRVIVE